MPYGSITVNTKTYDPRQPGVYSLTSLAFGDPADEFRIRGVQSVSKDQLLRASITRVLEKDVTTGDTSTRKQAVVTMTVAVPKSDYTAAEIDALASDISEFLTVNTLTRLMQGES
jgi:hypothetical protein